MTARVFFRAILGVLLLSPVVLGGCSVLPSAMELFNPSGNGPSAEASVYYLIVDILLLLIIIVPATALVIWTFFRYRRGGHGTYDPSFTHSKVIEGVVWGIPLLTVVALAYFSYEGVMQLNPYDPKVLENIPETKNSKPLQVDVITTNWQWLFVYPEQGVAVSNQFVIPVNRKISLRLTSAGVTNDFYILRIIGQIYVMPGMRTKQHFLVNRPGTYTGFSTEFSGPGFAWMNYHMKAMRPARFRQWVAKARRSGQQLSYQRFAKFSEPTVNTGNKTTLFNQVDPHLFRKVIANMKSGKLNHQVPMLMSEDMHSEEFKRHANGEIPN